jgi:CHAT domain-containing protein/Tfp pilus assembly protein PilF
MNLHLYVVKKMTIRILSAALMIFMLSGCGMQQSTSAPPAEQLVERGLTYYRNHDYHNALIRYNEALAMISEEGDQPLRADIYYKIGRVHLKEQHYKQSLAAYKESLALARDSGTRMDEAILHSSIGIIYQILGEIAAARNELIQALEIRRELDDQPGEVRTLVNLGATYLAQGRYGKALEYYQAAKELDDSLQSDHMRIPAVIVTHMGSLYAEMGQYDKAIIFHEQALTKYTDKNDSSGMATALHNIGYTNADQGNNQAAIAAFRESLSLREQQKEDQFGRADTLNSLGLTLAETGQTASALKMLEDALQILQGLNVRKQIAATLDSIGTVHKKLSNYSQALDYYSQSLVLWRQLGDRDGERITLANVGSVLALQDKNDAAIVFYKMSINITQEIRSELRFLPKKEQKAYSARIDENYRHLANLLIDRGRLAEAEQVLTMLKEEEFFDFMRRRSDLVEAAATVATLTKTELAEAARYAQINEELIALAREYEELAMRQSLGLKDDEQSRFEQLDKDLASARAKVRAYISELEALFDELGAERIKEFVKKDFEYLDEIRQELKSLGPGAVLLHILVTEDRLRLLLTAPDNADLSVHEDSDIGLKELNHLIAAFRETLQDPNSDPSAQAKVLYDRIMKPIESELLRVGARILLLSLDDILRYLPFAALHDGTQYLGERYGLVIYTAAARRHLTSPPRMPWEIAGLGVSEGAGATFSVLPAVKRELNILVRDVEHEDQFGVLPGVIRLNDDFSPNQLSADLRTGYEVVHIASHFKFQPGDETDSFLLLGADQKLTLADIQDGDYPLAGVDLLTLSACETAFGGRDAHGREIESLGVLAQKQGARAVLATLWSVDDSSTAEFMFSFYKLKQQGMTKAEALRLTQAAFMRGEGIQENVPEGSTEDRGAVNVDKTEGSLSTAARTYTHPYYWAPFILMGNSL